jgi:CDP-paratose 2-epimerase
LLVTGILRTVCSHFTGLGHSAHGIDNNQRAVFFEPAEDTRWNQRRLERNLPGFVDYWRAAFRRR